MIIIDQLIPLNFVLFDTIVYVGGHANVCKYVFICVYMQAFMQNVLLFHLKQMFGGTFSICRRKKRIHWTGDQTSSGRNDTEMYSLHNMPPTGWIYPHAIHPTGSSVMCSVRGLFWQGPVKVTKGCIFTVGSRQHITSLVFWLLQTVFKLWRENLQSAEGNNFLGTCLQKHNSAMLWMGLAHQDWLICRHLMVVNFGDVDKDYEQQGFLKAALSNAA